jgi:hypothetical protein
LEPRRPNSHLVKRQPLHLASTHHSRQEHSTSVDRQVQQVISSNTTETLRVTRCSLIYIILTYPIRSSCHTGFGQNLGGFASPQSGFGAARLSSGLGGLGGKTSPSSFGSGLGGVFAGSATQQTQGFGGTSTFGAGGGFGAPQQQQQVTYLYPILHYLI